MSKLGTYNIATILIFVDNNLFPKKNHTSIQVEICVLMDNIRIIYR